jgi:uncharacterized coiled-coil protein SlyX
VLLAAGIMFLVTEPAAAQGDRTEFDLLKAQVAAQQQQIDQLRSLLEAQARRLETLAAPPPSGLEQATAKRDAPPPRSENAKAEFAKAETRRPRKKSPRR